MSKLETPNKPDAFFGKRHIQFFLLFLTVVIAYGMRTCMSIGIIAMRKKDPPDPSIPTYPDWTELDKDIILSSFFWGYVVPQIGAGQLVKEYGPKWFLAATTAIGSIFSILIPVMTAQFGKTGVIICRVVQGLSQGFIYPSTHTLLGRWTPESERSRIISFVYVGGPLGTVLSMLLTGLIADSTNGWPMAFYLYGAVGLAWTVLWMWIGKDSPASHKSLSLVERRYIEGTDRNEPKIIDTPWKLILKSPPVWAILISHCGQNWGFWTLLTEIPSYMDKIIGLSMTSNSLWSALPYLTLWLLSFLFSWTADYLIERKYFSVGNVRKIFNTIGLILPAIALILLGFVDAKQATFAKILLVVAVGFNSATYCGFNTNHIDLSTNHAGVLMGITNSIANIFSILAPLSVQIYGLEESDPLLWQIVFCVAAAIYVITDVIFVIFGSGEIQSWNYPETINKPKIKTRF